MYSVNDYATQPNFTVRHNGQDIAQWVTRKRADEIAEGIRSGPRGFIQIYLTAKPLEGRKAAWRKQPLPRPASLRASATERATLAAKLRAEGILRDEPAMTYGDCALSIGAL